MKIKVENKWIYVDAAFDQGLENAGFPITKNWDGLSDAKFAFKPKEIIELDKKPPKNVKRLENRGFYEPLNKWLKLQRT